MENDKVLPFTRFIAAIVVAILVTAFIVLYLLPDRTAELFAWEIKPGLSAMFFGASYLGGAWVLGQAARGTHWHRVHAVFPVVTVFTTALLIATFLHWNRFIHGNLAFVLWTAIYIVSPLLIPALWFQNRREDSNDSEASDVEISPTFRLFVRIVGMASFITIFAAYLQPGILIRVWPWMLTPLTARVLCSWLSVIGVASWVLSFDPHWSAWRAILEGIFLASGLILLAMIMNSHELIRGILNWFTILLLVAMASILIFYSRLEILRRGR